MKIITTVSYSGTPPGCARRQRLDNMHRARPPHVAKETSKLKNFSKQVETTKNLKGTSASM
eukprot:1161107-Pelagomonas_calceolata.AAC.2